MKPKVKKLRLLLILVPLAALADRLDGVRDDDGRHARAAVARELRGVPRGEELGARCATGDKDVQIAQLTGNNNRILLERERHLAVHQERGDRDRGPALLRAQGRRLPRHRARALDRTSPRRRRPGRVDDHPAVREERAGGAGRPLGAPEAARGGARLSPRTALVEAEDPHPVPEHRLLRQRGLRRRVRGAHLLRRRRPQVRAGRAARQATSRRTRRRCWRR